MITDFEPNEAAAIVLDYKLSFFERRANPADFKRYAY
jgi:hypothetical protein